MNVCLIGQSAEITAEVSDLLFSGGHYIAAFKSTELLLDIFNGTIIEMNHYFDAIVICGGNFWKAIEALNCTLGTFLQSRIKKIAVGVDFTGIYLKQIRTDAARTTYLKAFTIISEVTEIESVLHKPNTKSKIYGNTDLNRRNTRMIDYKIQNLMFPDCEWKKSHWWMMYRGDELAYNEADKNWVLNSGTIECFTYFNSLSLNKWNEYTNAGKFNLHIKVKGEFTFCFLGRSLVSNNHKSTLAGDLEIVSKTDISSSQKRRFIHKIIEKAKTCEEKSDVFKYDTQMMTKDGIAEIVIPLELADSDVVGFEITTNSPMIIYGGHWSATISISQLNDVNISLCTTTFKKEKFIIPNIKILKEEILEAKDGTLGMDELSKHFYVNVVDNGSTLSANDIESKNITLHQNPNVGGAGGFSRGMLETLKLQDNGNFDATHILFMDDDVKILPESLKRTFALLRLLNEGYKQKFISGAMLDINNMNEQYEDLGFASDYMSMYMPVKPRMGMHLQENVLRNEADYPLDNRYAAWWYCCIPMHFIDANSLSLPIFYRGDDIEFSLRNKADFITMNGICVWHLAFNAKILGSLEYYLVNRNSMITQAISGILKNFDFGGRIKLMYGEEIRKFNYSACEQLLDALDDFLKGPEYIASLNGEDVIKQQSAKNEKMYTQEHFDFPIQWDKAYERQYLEGENLDIFLKTDNGHTLPDYVLTGSDLPPTIATLFFESPGKQYLQRRLIAADVYNGTAALRIINREKYAELRERKEKLFTRYEQNRENVIAEYKAWSEKLHSRGFWSQYLNR